jgi:hypothetical protein
MSALVTFDRSQVQAAATSLARRGVFIGTSSWKYPGWRGMLYDEARYLYRGKVAESRFEKQCLAEYAEVFKTVCVDAAYYKFPDRRYLEGLLCQEAERGWVAVQGRRAGGGGGGGKAGVALKPD